MTARQERLLTAIRRVVRTDARAFRHSRTTANYIDLMACLLDRTFLDDLWPELDSLLHDCSFDGIGGPATGAIPLVTAGVLRRGVQGFFVKSGRVEGTLRRGDHVLVVEDVVTTGETVRETIRVVEDAGGVVACVVAIVDRLEGADRRLKRYDYRALFNLNQVLTRG